MKEQPSQLPLEAGKVEPLGGGKPLTKEQLREAVALHGSFGIINLGGVHEPIASGFSKPTT